MPGFLSIKAITRTVTTAIQSFMDSTMKSFCDIDNGLLLVFSIPKISIEFDIIVNTVINTGSTAVK